VGRRDYARFASAAAGLKKVSSACGLQRYPLTPVFAGRKLKKPFSVIEEGSFSTFPPSRRGIIEYVELRPGVMNPALWYPARPAKTAWEAIRKAVLQRDNFTCQYCVHRALKKMHLHHFNASEDNSVRNLVTICVACRAVMHLGHSMSYGALAVYEATHLTQVEIVQRTRTLVASGMTLGEINKTFALSEGKYPPDNIEYANDLLRTIGDKPRRL
jgi:hypothetical protein